MDANNMVLSTTKLPSAPCWAGVVVGNSCLANPIPFGPGNMTIYVDVYSPESGAPVLLKVENCANGGISSEIIAVTSAANAWETLAFDFSNACPAPPDLANSYSKIIVFPQFTCAPDACGNPNPGTAPSSMDPYYFDNISMTPPTPVAPALPITFGDIGTDYNFGGFGGANGVVGADPTNPNNSVFCLTEDPGAQCWAGVTVGGPAPTFCLDSPVDFSAGTTITMDVYSPNAGASILLKFEDCGNGGISTELIALTTVANAWETLTFDYSMGCPNPPNLGNTYNKMSVFAEFTCSPDACGNANPNTAPSSTMSYYFDNIQQEMRWNLLCYSNYACWSTTV